MQCPSYMDTAMYKTNLKKLICSAASILKKNKIHFDAIAFRGMSGAVFAPILAYRLNKHLIVVRKSTRNSHSSFKVQGEENIKKYIIVDDIIHTGATVDSIRKDMNIFSDNAECVGILLYNPDDSNFVSEYKSIPIYSARID